MLKLQSKRYCYDHLGKERLEGCFPGKRESHSSERSFALGLTLTNSFFKIEFLIDEILVVKKTEFLRDVLFF